MYLSRYHYTNSKISVALDSLTGEVLEFIKEDVGENIIKNHSFNLRQPFRILAKIGEEKKNLHGGNEIEITKEPKLTPLITSENAVDGGVIVKVHYPYLSDGTNHYAVSTTYTIELPADSEETHWYISVDNQEDDVVVQQVQFPCINGVYIGDSWEDDTLYFPRLAGLRIPNAVEAFCRSPQSIQWKWQRYRYSYLKNRIALGPDKDGLYTLSAQYSGFLSMTWLAYTGEDICLYFANHDKEPRACGLTADSYGTRYPGMNFYFHHYPEVEPHQSWSSPMQVVALYTGDWHVAAKKYRAFREQHLECKPKMPKWMERSPGLMAHYDFKYQTGGVVHRYEDLPRLLDEAHELGINHLLCAGWHKDGFDHGFPAYTTDPDLGTEEDLKQNVKTVNDRGGHVVFYMNDRLANTKYTELDSFIHENVIVREDGKENIEGYGNTVFATMCLNTEAWRNKIKDTVKYMTEDIGIDGTYMDQLATVGPGYCHNKAHGHAIDDWNCSGQKLLTDVGNRYRETHNGENPWILYEGVTDAYGGYTSGHLVQNFSHYFGGAFPEMYKYTYPEQILCDPVYPKRNMAMRPVHIGQISTELINLNFMTGSYFWIYDLVDDNTFTRDPIQYAYLRKIITLRQYWLDTFGHGTFRDTEDLKVEGPHLVKRFTPDDANGALFACTSEFDCTSTLLLPADERVDEVVLYTVAEDNNIACTKIEAKHTAEGTVITLPNVPMCLLRTLPKNN